VVGRYFFEAAPVDQCPLCLQMRCIVEQSGQDASDEADIVAPRNAATRGEVLEPRHFRFVAYAFFARILRYQKRQPLPRCVTHWVEQRWGQSQVGFQQ